MEIGSNAEYRAAGVGVDLLRAGPREFSAELSIASGSIGLGNGLEVADGSLALVLADDVVKIGAAVLRVEGAFLEGDGAWNVLPRFGGSWVGRLDSGVELTLTLLGEAASGSRLEARVELGGKADLLLVDLDGTLSGLIVGSRVVEPLEVGARFEIGTGGVSVPASHVAGYGGARLTSGRRGGSIPGRAASRSLQRLPARGRE